MRSRRRGPRRASRRSPAQQETAGAGVALELLALDDRHARTGSVRLERDLDHRLVEHRSNGVPGISCSHAAARVAPKRRAGSRRDRSPFRVVNTCVKRSSVTPPSGSRWATSAGGDGRPRSLPQLLCAAAIRSAATRGWHLTPSRVVFDQRLNVMWGQALAAAEELSSTRNTQAMISPPSRATRSQSAPAVPPSRAGRRGSAHGRHPRVVCVHLECVDPVLERVLGRERVVRELASLARCTKPACSSLASAPPRMKPRASAATTKSTSSSRANRVSRDTAASSARGSSSSGVMSLKTIPAAEVRDIAHERAQVDTRVLLRSHAWPSYVAILRRSRISRSA